MKIQTKQFRSLSVALKELEPFIRHGEHLQTGKPFDNFGGLRSRELLANWLLCVTFNAESGDDRMTFTTDPEGGDGIIYDSKTEQPYPTEHVIVPQVKREIDKSERCDRIDYDAMILAAIEQKRRKGGEAYARGKSLIVFLNAGGDGAWFPNRVARKLPSPLYFEVVWVAGLHQVQADGEYVYGVAQLDVSEGDTMVWQIRIGKNFDTWRVVRIQ